MTDQTRNLLISLASHMAYMQGQLEARHELDDPEDYYWYRESVALRQKVTDALADGPAVPEGREPASVVSEPSDRELLELMPETMRDEFAYAATTCSDATGGQVKPGIFRVCLNTAALEYARAVLAADGRQPAPPAAGEVGELGEVTTTERGFELIEFLDCYDQPCSLQQSSLAIYATAGTSAIWLGQGDDRMHLNEDQVKALITHLQRWLDNGSFRPAAPPAPLEGEVGELVADLRRICFDVAPCDADAIDRVADLLEQRHPAPVPASERLPGDQLCWWYEPDEDDGYGGMWTLLRIRGGTTRYTHWLPFTALPLPAGEVE